QLRICCNAGAKPVAIRIELSDDVRPVLEDGHLSPITASEEGNKRRVFLQHCVPVQPQIYVLANLDRPNDLRPARILVGGPSAAAGDGSSGSTTDSCACNGGRNSRRHGVSSQWSLHVVLDRCAPAQSLLNGFDDDRDALSTANAGGAKA